MGKDTICFGQNQLTYNHHCEGDIFSGAMPTISKDKYILIDRC